MNNQVVKDFLSAMEENKKSTSAYDTTAKVLRVEGTTAWVHIPGGVDETPVAMTVSAKAGDSVRVRVSGGSAWITGSDSAPPTDDRMANIANTRAVSADVKASTALEDAETARTAAESAVTSASAASQAADDAQTAAGEASAAANNAITQLSTVEDVVGVLNWISEHGTYVITSDTEVVEGKYYFTRSGSGTTADPYVYTVVVSPSGDPSAQSWYELDSVDEAVSNYISTHLVLTDEGLWVTMDDTGYRVKITSSGVYIVNPLGVTVASYGVDVILGDSNSISYMTLSKTGFGVTFDGGNTETIAAHLIDGTMQQETETGTRSMYQWQLKNINLQTDIAIGQTITIDLNTDYQFPDQITLTAGVAAWEVHALEYQGSYVDFYYDGGTHVQFYSTYEGSFNLYFTVTYYRQPDRSAYFTFGQRKSGSINGKYSLVEGYDNTASGENSHAEGTESVASGDNSHAQNNGTVAASDDQTAIGRFNKSDANDTYAFIIGNGSSTNARSDAMDVEWDGETRIALDASAATGTTDGDLYAAITSLGWASDVIV